MALLLDGAQFRAHAAGLPLLLTVRLLPISIYAMGSRRVPWLGRLLAAGAIAALAALGWWLELPLSKWLYLCGTLVYFALCAVAIHRVRASLAAGAMTSGAFLVLAIALYLLVPALALPSLQVPAAMALGWDMTLSAYSYGIDTRGQQRQSTLRECCFFMLVNPMLVFAERGADKGAAELDWRTCGRVAAGLATLLAYCAVAAVLAASSLTPVSPLQAASGRYFTFVAYYGARFFAFYLSHSGLASVQIGVMRMLGYQLPERYRLPFLAANFEDFWRRWNVWVGRWALRYAFYPSALWLRRRTRDLPGLISNALAVCATFLVVGGLHDILTLLLKPSGRLDVRWTVFLGTAGLLYLVSYGLGKLLTQPAAGSAAPLRRVRAVGGWLLLIHAQLLLCWLFLTLGQWLA